MRIDETCLARVQVAREWRGCWTNCRQDQKLARNYSTRLVIGGSGEQSDPHVYSSFLELISR